MSFYFLLLNNQMLVYFLLSFSILSEGVKENKLGSIPLYKPLGLLLQTSAMMMHVYILYLGFPPYDVCRSEYPHKMLKPGSKCESS